MGLIHQTFTKSIFSGVIRWEDELRAASCDVAVPNAQRQGAFFAWTVTRVDIWGCPA